MNCTKCGQELVRGDKFCGHCGESVVFTPVRTAFEKPENILAGTLGALLGAVIGGIVIVLLSRLGVMASLSGIILAVCSMKGYALLGGRMSKKGIAISVVFMLVMPYLADRIDWAILIFQEAQAQGLDWNLGQCFMVIPEMITEGIIAEDVYLSNLLQLYVFTGIGVLATLFGSRKKK